MTFKNLCKTALIVSFPFAVACENAETEKARTDGYTVELKTPEDSLYHQVMEDHNIAMARMGKLNRYIREVQRQKDSTQKLTPGQQRRVAAYRNSLDSVGKQLEEAEQAMNTWMDQFNLDSASESNRNRKSYLEAEKVRVLKVKNHILSSLDSADSLFSNANNNQKATRH